SADLNTCRAALAQVNQFLGRQATSDAARTIPPEQVDFLRKQFELREDEWAEISSDTFTLLDGHHLETALLVRDAAASFTPAGFGAAPACRSGVRVGRPPGSPARRARFGCAPAARGLRRPPQFRYAARTSPPVSGAASAIRGAGLFSDRPRAECDWLCNLDLRGARRPRRSLVRSAHGNSATGAERERHRHPGRGSWPARRAPAVDDRRRGQVRRNCRAGGPSPALRSAAFVSIGPAHALPGKTLPGPRRIGARRYGPLGCGCDPALPSVRRSTRRRWRDGSTRPGLANGRPIAPVDLANHRGRAGQERPTIVECDAESAGS